MLLKTYLDARGEKYADFGRRCHVKAATIRAIAVTGVRPRADVAHAIITASREEPAPDGGTVTLEELGYPPQRQAVA